MGSRQPVAVLFDKPIEDRRAAEQAIEVTVNGEVTNSVPVSPGKSSMPTPNGVYYVSDKHASMIMDPSTFGVPVDPPEGYRTPVDWATRISYSGIFVHGAPWPVWAQGNTNVSNGCINATNAEAKWFYDNHTLGDVVEVVNTSPKKENHCAVTD